MTYKDQFTPVESTQYMVMNVVDEIYDTFDAFGNFITLGEAVDLELNAADEIHKVIKKAMS